jgi:hypothetical protein
VKKTLLVVVLIDLLFAGCQQPGEVEIVTEPNTTDLEVIPIVRPDTIIVTSAVDTTAVLPADQVSYVGQFIVNKITLNAGPGKVDSFAYSRVVVSDSVVRYLFRLVGFNGVDLGAVALNGTAMVKVPHQITVKSFLLRDTVLTCGVEYRTDLSRTYQSSSLYTWSAPSASTGAVSVSIASPGALEVFSPRGGEIYSREKDLLLAWKAGDGQLRVIISIFEPLTRKSFPILELRPRTNTGKALLPASVLRQFPMPSHYVFTFILFNKREIGVNQVQGGKVLVQSAAVYNSYIQLP